MSFPLVPQPRPQRGARVLAKEKADAEALKHELAVKKMVKARDGRCRWPEKHKCRGLLEAAHIQDASLGGEMETHNLVLLCAWIHRRGPESVHGKQIQVYKDTMDGADGPLSFWRRSPEGGLFFYLVKREIRPFEYEQD